jgi:hypothetical protein
MEQEPQEAAAQHLSVIIQRRCKFKVYLLKLTAPLPKGRSIV